MLNMMPEVFRKVEIYICSRDIPTFLFLLFFF